MLETFWEIFQLDQTRIRVYDYHHRSQYDRQPPFSHSLLEFWIKQKHADSILIKNKFLKIFLSEQFRVFYSKKCIWDSILNILEVLNKPYSFFNNCNHIILHINRMSVVVTCALPQLLCSSLKNHFWWMALQQSCWTPWQKNGINGLHA